MTDQRNTLQRRQGEERRTRIADAMDLLGIERRQHDRRQEMRRKIANARANHMTEDFFHRYHAERRRLGLGA